MSRYNEDWQRRKAYLIRSLFNDIPYRVLSPVIEESTSSTNGKDFIESEQSFTSSEDRIRSEYQPYFPPKTVKNIISPPVTVSTIGDRPWSPLPPLIIEREPNRHDEPLEYYEKLLIKIKNMYKKMFLESKQLSEDDFFENFNEHNSITDKSLNNESSFYSNGYTADDESIDCEYSINENHRSKSLLVGESLNDRSLRYDNIDKGMQSFVNDIHINIDSPGEDMQLDSSVPNEEPNYSQITIVADVHMDGQPPPEITPSPIYEDPPPEVPSVQNLILTAQEQSDKQLRDSSQRTYHKILDLARDIPEHCTSQSKCAQLQHQQTAVRKDSLMGDTTTHELDELLPYLIQPAEPDQRLEVSQCLIGGHCNKSPVLECQRQKQGTKGGIVSRYDRTDEVMEDHQASASNQVTVQAEVHTEYSRRDKIIEVPQDSPANVRRSQPSGERSQCSQRDLTMLEDLQDPETIVQIQNIEVMRTPRQADTSLDSIPGGNTRMPSDMDFTCEHNTIAQDISNMTSQSQNGGHVKSTAEQKISVDFDDVIASIFNDSNHIQNINANKPSSTRKRRYEAISVQTDGVTWNDFRTDFFVGTPKIFRLCSCINHVCC